MRELIIVVNDDTLVLRKSHLLCFCFKILYKKIIYLQIDYLYANSMLVQNLHNDESRKENISLFSQ